MASERSAPMLVSPSTGVLGVAWVTEGLLCGLLSLDPGSERYCIVGYAEHKPICRLRYKAGVLAPARREIGPGEGEERCAL
ncbi:MAG TPA: hypothetical protein DIW77_11750 [Chromatiaceae bacterium]|jgi:hypothetical protein|nr:hypothetical protein [Chromatiaceae bacterium]